MLAISTYRKNQMLTQLTEGFVNESLKNFMDRITDGGSEKRHRKCKFFKSFFRRSFLYGVFIDVVTVGVFRPLPKITV